MVQAQGQASAPCVYAGGPQQVHTLPQSLYNQSLLVYSIVHDHGHLKSLCGYGELQCCLSVFVYLTNLRLPDLRRMLYQGVYGYLTPQFNLCLST